MSHCKRLVLPGYKRVINHCHVWLKILVILVLGEHLPGGEAHDAAPHGGEHAHLEAGEGDDGGPEARGHEQGPGNGNLL